MSQTFVEVTHLLPGGGVATTVVGSVPHLPGPAAPIVMRCRNTTSLWGEPRWLTWRLHEGRFLCRDGQYRLGYDGAIHLYDDSGLTPSQVRQAYERRVPRNLAVVEGRVWSYCPAPTLTVDAHGHLTVDGPTRDGPGVAVAYLWQHKWVTHLLGLMGAPDRVPEVDVVRPDLLAHTPLPSPGAVAARLGEARHLARHASALQDGTITAQDLQRLRDEASCLLSLYRLETNPTHPAPHEGATHA